MRRVAVNFHLVRGLQGRHYDFEDLEAETQDLIDFLASENLVILPEKAQLDWSKLLEENMKRKP